jgi:transposase
LISRKDETIVLCRSEARIQKDKAIREKAERRLLADIEKLAKRVDAGTLKNPDRIHEAIGRLKERHCRVARYYQIMYTPQNGFASTLVKEKRAIAEELDGTYILKTNRNDMSADEIWRTYILLTRVENAFRTMKSPLSERPIFHHLPHRVETHIFLCVLAYHIVAAVEKKLRDAGEYTSWATVRRDMSTHQIITVCLPMVDGSVLRIRKATKPEPHQEYIYNALEIEPAIMAPQKSLHRFGRAAVVAKRPCK